MADHLADLPRRHVPGTDLDVPVLGLGCAALGNLYRALPDDAASAALEAAWAAGLRYFDTAPHYGHGLSETRLGRFLGHREGAILSTKVGRTLVPVADEAIPDFGFVDPLPFAPTFDYSAAAVEAQIAGSIERLGGRQPDILFIHDLGRMTHGADHPARLAEALAGAMPVLQGLRHEGAIRAIGLGVNEWEIAAELMDHLHLDLVLLAGRYTLLEQGALKPFLERCLNAGTGVVIGGPYNSGVLARPAGEGHYDYGAVPGEIAVRVAHLRDLAARHEVALQAAALQFPLAHPAVVSVIPGGRDAGEIEANIRFMTTALPAAFWHDLRKSGLIDPEAPVPLEGVG